MIRASLPCLLLTMTLVSCSPEGAWDLLRIFYAEQGSTVTLFAVQDSSINSGAQTTNYGLCTDIITNRSGGTDLGVRRLLIQFDLSSIPAGATISRAELKLTKLGVLDDPVNFNFHRVANAWDEGVGMCGGFPDTVNWLQRMGGFAWGAAGGDYDPGFLATELITTDQQYTWSSAALTTVVSNWYQGIINNYGLIGGSPDGGTDDIIFASRGYSHASPRPKLVVTYTLP